MPNKPKSTHCRYCGLPGDLEKGAHRKCFNSKPQFDASIPGAREAYNRGKAIYKLIREKKLTRQAAEEYYDAKSLRCDCGAAKGRQAIRCHECAKKKAAERSAAYEAANREKIRRADVIRKRMKAGMTREEAEAKEERKGVCECGRPARYTGGRICEECYREKDRDSHRGIVRLVAKLCATCGTAFMGTSNAKYCEAHKNGHKAKTLKKRVSIPATWGDKAKPKPAPSAALPPPPPEMLAKVVRHEIRWSRWDD